MVEKWLYEHKVNETRGIECNHFKSPRAFNALNIIDQIRFLYNSTRNVRHSIRTRPKGILINVLLFICIKCRLHSTECWIQEISRPSLNALLWENPLFLVIPFACYRFQIDNFNKIEYLSVSINFID